MELGIKASADESAYKRGRRKGELRRDINRLESSIVNLWATSVITQR